MSKKTLLFLLICGCVFVLCYFYTDNIMFTITIEILYGVAYLFNWIVIKKIYIQKEPLSVYSEIRNVDYLIIGEYCKTSLLPITKEDSYIEILSPARSYEASYQILRHTHSILKEGGTVIISVGKKKKGYTVFDIPFFHEITIKELKLNRLKKMSHIPFLFSPLRSIKLIIGQEEHNMHLNTKGVPSELRAFCEERNYNLIFLNK